ncbi:sugar phosphate nucleotidyltransferase [Undibacterium arcticum]|uniref:sugar phosphate nucleotidyltransferase n=1 Tax=Undibacterium arcticum TaxID=1762892 RepID=UPI0036134873
MTTPLVPVILCGGSGTRLWPLSRETYPKQFTLAWQGNPAAANHATACRYCECRSCHSRLQ